MNKIEGKPPLKVLIVIGSLEIGGAEKHVAALAVGLKERNIEVAICGLSSGGALEKGLLKNKIRLFFPKATVLLGVLLRVKFLRRLLFYLRSAYTFFEAYTSFRPRIVHFFLPGAYIQGGLMSLLIPDLCRIMSRRSLNLYQDKKPMLKKLEGFLHTKMNLITGNSKRIIGELSAEGVDSKKLHLIYNGVSIPEREAWPKASYNSQVEILCVANIIPYKGHIDLLNALALIPKAFKWHLTCVGRDDNYKSELDGASSKLGVNDRVTFVGAVIDPSVYLQKADIGVNASHQEGFSNALLEYMSYGLGIVATDVGGNSEAIRHQLDGIIVPAKHPVEMSMAIRRLFDRSERWRLGENARKRASENFSCQSCWDSYAEIYEGSVSDKKESGFF